MAGETCTVPRPGTSAGGALWRGISVSLPMIRTMALKKLSCRDRRMMPVNKSAILANNATRNESPSQIPNVNFAEIPILKLYSSMDE